MKTLLSIFALLTVHNMSSQNNNKEIWTENELVQHSKLIALANYVYGKDKNEISTDTLFSKYVYFDYVLNDTVSERKERRVQVFDTLFYYFKKPIDSIGIENLDAKPIRFFKEHEIYEPFADELKKIEPFVFAYYDKRNSQVPLGRLFFEHTTNKLAAWILIQQGRRHYFLTFSLL
jgi:hypothetical protein